MSINRRQFTKLAVFGGISATTCGIFFPKPAESFALDFLVSNKTVQNVFKDLLVYTGARVIDSILPERTNQRTRSVVESADREFVKRNYTEDKTPFAGFGEEDLLWGRQRGEELGPNPGFAIVDPSNSNSVAQFTGSTTVGIDGAMKILADQKLSPNEIQASLIPWRVEFEDWGTWEGDKDPFIGKNPNVSLASYRTRIGQVIRRYELLEPGKGGLGQIRLIVEAANQPKRVITTQVRFT